jgi:hypothetical protein
MGAADQRRARQCQSGAKRGADGPACGLILPEFAPLAVLVLAGNVLAHICPKPFKDEPASRIHAEEDSKYHASASAISAASGKMQIELF